MRLSWEICAGTWSWGLPTSSLQFCPRVGLGVCVLLRFWWCFLPFSGRLGVFWFWLSGMYRVLVWWRSPYQNPSPLHPLQLTSLLALASRWLPSRTLLASYKKRLHPWFLSKWPQRPSSLQSKKRKESFRSRSAQTSSNKYLGEKQHSRSWKFQDVSPMNLDAEESTKATILLSSLNSSKSESLRAVKGTCTNPDCIKKGITSHLTDHCFLEYQTSPHLQQMQPKKFMSNLWSGNFTPQAPTTPVLETVDGTAQGLDDYGIERLYTVCASVSEAMCSPWLPPLTACSSWMPVLPLTACSSHCLLILNACAPLKSDFPCLISMPMFGALFCSLIKPITSTLS